MQDELSRLLKGKTTTNPGREFPRERYDQALAGYLATVGRIVSVRSVYQIGSIGVPGLSDIDLVVILKEGQRDFLHRYGIGRLSDEDRYLFSHDPLVIDARTFANMHVWYPVREQDLCQHFGDSLPREPLGPLQNRFKLLHLAQCLLCYQFQMLRRFTFFGDTIDQRNSENSIKGFCNSLSLWIEVKRGHADSKYAAFREEYLEFRKSWFRLDATTRAQTLGAYAVGAAALAFELIGEVDLELRSNWFSSAPPGNLDFEMGGDRFSFQNIWSPEAAAGHFVATQGLLFPSSFAQFMLAYRESNGAIGRHVRAIFGAAAETPIQFSAPEAEQAIKLHVRALDEYSLFNPLRFRVAPNPFVTFWAPYSSSRFVRVFNRGYNKFMRLLEGAFTASR